MAGVSGMVPAVDKDRRREIGAPQNPDMTLGDFTINSPSPVSRMAPELSLTAAWAPHGLPISPSDIPSVREDAPATQFASSVMP